LLVLWRLFQFFLNILVLEIDLLDSFAKMTVDFVEDIFDDFFAGLVELFFDRSGVDLE
jgi:hypothetical protein